MMTCPYCSSRVLRHFHNSRLYWFCRRCWREVPQLEPACRESVTVSRSSLSEFQSPFDVPAYWADRLIKQKMITDTFR